MTRSRQGNKNNVKLGWRVPHFCGGAGLFCGCAIKKEWGLYGFTFALF